MRTLEFEVRGQKLERKKSCRWENIVAGSVNYLRVKFYFYGNEWTDYDKAVSFFADGSGGLKEDGVLLDNNDSCVIPARILIGPEFSLSVSGIKGNNMIKTNRVTVEQEVV